MKIGFNFTLNGTLDMVQRLIRERQVDYCEILIDNFLHVPPAELADAFDCPLAFHIMFSRYLESDRATLEKLAGRLRIFIEALNPLYVSDHVLRFTHHDRHFFHLGEVDYVREYDHIRRQVEVWQDLLGTRLYLENYPSIMDGGWDAPAFYKRLERDTGAGVLFDASNAVCAMHNCGAPLALWTDIIKSTQHFHVAGYGTAFIEEKIKADSHDREMSDDTMRFLTDMRSAFEKPGATITYERDFEIDYDSVAVDLQRLRHVFLHTGEADHEPDFSCASSG